MKQREVAERAKPQDSRPTSPLRTPPLGAAVRSLVEGRGTTSRPSGPKAETYRNMGEGLARAFELAVTPSLFGLMGYGLDRWIGIVPVLTLVLALVAIVGMLLRTWYGYVYRMQALEEAGPWAKRA